MKKSKNVTKYDLEWQILRSSIKGKMNNDLEQKLLKVRDYYLETKTYDRWERVVNWLEGLSRGFKASKNLVNIDIILNEISFYIEENPLKKEEYEVSMDTSKYSQEELLVLWKDLFRTNRKWLEKGYYHRECNNFLDNLQLSLKNVPENYSYEKLKEMRLRSHNINNKHKFFF